MPVSAQLDLKLSAHQDGVNTFGGPFWSAAMSLSQGFTDGTTANKIDKIYLAERSVAASTNDDIDLSGVLTDVLGATITAAELVGIMILNKPKADGAVNTTNLTVGGGTNPVVGFLGGTTPTVGPIKPGGCFLLMNPDATGLGAITASTGDILRVANSSGATNLYQIALLMRSA